MSIAVAPKEKIVIRETSHDVVERLSQELTVSKLVASILVARGLETYDQCERFFRPDISHFHDPFLFQEMKTAVERIRLALAERQKIVVYGDYDVDGISSTGLMVSVLENAGATVDYYLPNRLVEGYGVSVQGLEEIHSKGAQLVITVDCGITSYEALGKASELGLDVVVTDHHEPGEHRPEALAVINPKMKGSPYPDRNLAGVGVALKLAQALAVSLGMGKELWYPHLDLVALGTAADIVPLTGENRIITHFGFKELGRTRRPGLLALIREQGLEGKELSTRDVVFQLTPCINAAGRLGDPTRGVRLLLTRDAAEAELFARELKEANTERRALDRQVFEEAQAQAEQLGDPQQVYGLVLADKNWHLGVIGIAASRIVDAFYRPTFLFSIGEDGMAKGSGRSVPGVHLLEVLHDCQDLLEGFGGHAAAAGATIKEENLPVFRERFNEAVSNRIRLDQLVPIITADAETDIVALTSRFHNILKRMAPFGPGNMRPVLMCRGLQNRYKPRVVGKNHLKLAVSCKGYSMDAIAFNFGDRLHDVQAADTYSLAFTLDENEWNGRVSLQMKVKGVEA